MRMWKLCRQCCSSSTLLPSIQPSQTSCMSNKASRAPSFSHLPSLHFFWFSNTIGFRTSHSAALDVAASSSRKRDFHSSSTAEGHKSGPGSPSWKYVNIQSKPVPKPPKGTRLPRFYVPTQLIRDAREGSVFQLSESETKHALRVLRMSEGAWLEVCDGKGLLIEAQLRGLTYSNRAFATATSDPTEVAWEGPKWEVVAALGGLKGGRADTLVEKITELGAWSLRPLMTHRSRTIGRFEEKTEVRIISVEELSDVSELEEEADFAATGRLGRWERVGMAAGKQSLRAHALLIRPPCLLESLLPLMKSGAPAFVATQGAPPLQQVLAADANSLQSVGESGSNKPCILLVGPEGDFTEQEMKDMLAAGAKPVGLGPNRLRVETAAMAMVTGAVLHYESLKAHSQQSVLDQQEQLVA